MISQVCVIIYGTDTIFPWWEAICRDSWLRVQIIYLYLFTKMVYLKVSNLTCFVFLQTHLLNPTLIDLTLQFYIATASWLNQVALAGDNFEEMTSFKEVEIPLPTEVGKHYIVHAFCTYSYFACLLILLSGKGYFFFTCSKIYFGRQSIKSILYIIRDFCFLV